MIIVIDAGNSAVKVARIDGDDFEFVQAVPIKATADDLFRSTVAQRILADLPARDGAGAVLVSVVPAWTAAFRQAASNLNVTLLVAEHQTIPIPVRVPLPGGVGADRLLDAYAAARLHGTPVIVVDMGTATTVDAVDASGAFVGGAILPGIELGARALASGTAQLPHVDVAQLPSAIGNDTPSAIASGVVLGQIGAIRELVDRIALELVPAGSARPTVVVTGGALRAVTLALEPLPDTGPRHPLVVRKGVAHQDWAEVWLQPFNGRPPIADIVDPDLTLRGLGLLHAELARIPA